MEIRLEKDGDSRRISLRAAFRLIPVRQRVNRRGNRGFARAPCLLSGLSKEGR